jgi:hypothetical protein
MPRAKKPLALTVTDNADAGAIYSAGNALTELAQHNQEVETMARAVAVQIGYDLPADSTDPDLIQRDIRANMARSVQACMEVGKGLMVLKAVCGHGNFVARLDVLNIETRVAQRFMSSARRFSNAASTPLLKAAGNQTKLFEMLLLDDEELEELQLTGTTGELSLDDVATMSVKELRHAVRDLRQDKEATDRLLGEKDEKLNALKRKPKLSPEEQAEHELAPLFGLVAEGLNYLLRLQAEVFGLAESEVPVLQIAARNAINLIAERLVHTSQEVQVPIDYDSTGPELKAFHDKVLGI